MVTNLCQENQLQPWSRESGTKIETANRRRTLKGEGVGNAGVVWLSSCMFWVKWEMLLLFRSLCGVMLSEPWSLLCHHDCRGGEMEGMA